MLDQAEIDRLVRVTKMPVQSPAPQLPQLSTGHLRTNFDLQSQDGEDRFQVFIRVNEVLCENFSVGLIYKPKEGGKVVLMRCNGEHGDHQNKVVNLNRFSGPHIHFAKAEAIDQSLKEENYAEPTSEYFTWEEAFRVFIQRANIVGMESFFQFLQQPSLFEGTGEAV
jgi:hypothetical protein